MDALLFEEYVFNELLQLYGWTQGILYYRLPSGVGTITIILCILASVEVIREKNALCTPVQQVRLVTGLMVSSYRCKSGCGSCSSWRGC